MREIDICIVSYNTQSYLEGAVKSIKEYSTNYTLTVVDNGSTDGSVEWLLQQKGLDLVLNKSNIGYGSALNLGFKQKNNNPYLCVMNSDVEIVGNWQEELIGCLKGDVACVGPKLLFPDGRIGGCGVVGTEKERILRGWQEEDRGQYDETEEVISVCGAFMVMRRDVFEQVGGFDEQFKFYFEETDLHLRMRHAGYKILYYPRVEVIHYWNKSPKGEVDYMAESKRKFDKKWGFEE